MLRKLAQVLAAVVLSTVAFAQDYVAQTAEDPKVPRDELALRLKPLRADELKAEADAWLDRLSAHNRQLADLQVQAMAAEGDAKVQLLERINQERDVQIGLTDRLNDVLAALVAKGSEDDAKPYEAYIAASTGIEIQTTDVHALWATIYGWLTSEEGGIRVGINILKFLLTLLVFKFLASFLGNVTRRATAKLRGTSDLLRDFFVNTVRKVTFFIGLIIALSMLEVNIGPFLAALGAAGFVIGFALQGTLSNFASGIMILIYRPYDIGEVVTVAGTTGKVDAMSLVSTTLRLPDNQCVVVPNNSIWGDVITNITGSATRRVDLMFGCGYGDDLKRVERVLMDIVKSHPKVLQDPEPVVKLHELADSSVNFVVRPWCATSDYWDVYWDVSRQVKERFDAEGLNIPFPQRDVHVHQVMAQAPA